MSECAGGIPLIKSVTVEDSLATQLLNDYEVRQGLDRVDYRLADYHRELEEEGNKVQRTFEGVTEEGLVIAIAEVIKPDLSCDFSIFTYPLDAVKEVEFTDALVPREAAVVTRSVGSTVVALAKTGERFTATSDDLEKAQKAGLKRRNPPAFRRLVEEVEVQMFGPGVDKLTIPKRLTSYARWNGEEVRSFDWHAFGNRRRAVIRRVIDPLVRAESDLNHPARTREDPSREYRNMLFRRSQQTKAIMLENPATIDRATDQFVFDPVKAEYMADAMNKVAMGDWSKAALRAAAEYDADPAGVKSPRKGLSDRTNAI